MAPTATSKRTDDAIAVVNACLDLHSPNSFFLYAGAGSGKTRALVDALHSVRDRHGRAMRLRGKHVAVITYTNAACDEISDRVLFDPLFTIKTIHSFAWDELVKGFNDDIRAWLHVILDEEIAELRELLTKGRPGTKIAEQRERSIQSKTRRKELLSSIKRFTYNPNGDNRERDSLNHSEVIKISSYFLENKPLLQEIITRKFPFILIDESQDTSRVLMEALLSLQLSHRETFALGLFGDTMQRIYADGKADLGQSLPPDWRTPGLTVNHRCPRRVVRLINRVRSEVDGHSQEARADAAEGHIRLFLCPASAADKPSVERHAAKEMAIVTGDANWEEPLQVKTLTLEHHMAARRMGFGRMFDPLYRVDDFRTGLLDGTLAIVRFFSGPVLELVDALKSGDRFAAARVVRRESPLLKEGALLEAGNDQALQLKKAQTAADGLLELWNDDEEPCFLDILSCLSKTELLMLPDPLLPFVEGSDAVPGAGSDGYSVAAVDDQADSILATREFLRSPFSQISSYAAYVRDEAPFGTHQGVKGLEFPRVLVVADDADARGFLFSYEKLFGVKAKSATDLKNEKEGNETGYDRTRRLFYVTCSRAAESLAVVAYSEDSTEARRIAIDSKWFDDDEIVVIDG